MTIFASVLILVGGCFAYVMFLLLIGKMLQKSNSDKAMRNVISDKNK